MPTTARAARVATPRPRDSGATQKPNSPLPAASMRRPIIPTSLAASPSSPSSPCSRMAQVSSRLACQPGPTRSITKARASSRP